MRDGRNAYVRNVMCGLSFLLQNAYLCFSFSLHILLPVPRCKCLNWKLLNMHVKHIFHKIVYILHMTTENMRCTTVVFATKATTMVVEDDGWKWQLHWCMVYLLVCICLPIRSVLFFFWKISEKSTPRQNENAFNLLNWFERLLFSKWNIHNFMRAMLSTFILGICMHFIRLLLTFKLHYTCTNSMLYHSNYISFSKRQDWYANECQLQ